VKLRERKSEVVSIRRWCTSSHRGEDAVRLDDKGCTKNVPAEATWAGVGLEVISSTVTRRSMYSIYLTYLLRDLAHKIDRHIQIQ
jgi:hypothetical protein